MALACGRCSAPMPEGLRRCYWCGTGRDGSEAPIAVIAAAAPPATRRFRASEIAFAVGAALLALAVLFAR